MKEVVVVLGANAEIIKQEIQNLPVYIVCNKDWEEGMSSSIRCGLSTFLRKSPSAEFAVFMVCDQPFVTASLLNQLIAKCKESKKTIVACEYKEAVGTPVLFDKIYFPELLELKGASGAKKIISGNMDSTVTIPFPLGYIDIDTKEDYEALLRKQFNY